MSERGMTTERERQSDLPRPTGVGIPARTSCIPAPSPTSGFNSGPESGSDSGPDSDGGSVRRPRVPALAALVTLAALAVGFGALVLSVVMAAPASAAVLPPAPSEAVELGQALDALDAAVGLAPEGPGAYSQRGAQRGAPGVAERSAQTQSSAARSSSATRAEPIDSAALLAAVTRLQAADLLYRDRLATVSDRLEAIGASGEILDRFDRARARYEASVATILDPLAAALAPTASTEDPSSSTEEDTPEARAARLQTLVAGPEGPAALDAVRSALRAARAATSPEILRAAVLPYGRLSLAQRTPVEEPAVQPAYLDPLDPAAAPADLAASRLAPLADPILLEAERLDHDLVEIFERVRNGIATEWYAGAMKGAEETLRQGAGNDADQAALLVALLRASGVPARFVRGVVELSPEQIGDDLGLVDSAGGGGARPGGRGAPARGRRLPPDRSWRPGGGIRGGAGLGGGADPVHQLPRSRGRLLRPHLASPGARRGRLPGLTVESGSLRHGGRR